MLRFCGGTSIMARLSNHVSTPTLINPSSGRSKPASRRKIVVFPAPEAPDSTAISFFSMVSRTLSSNGPSGPSKFFIKSSSIKILIRFYSLRKRASFPVLILHISQFIAEASTPRAYPEQTTLLGPEAQYVFFRIRYNSTLPSSIARNRTLPPRSTCLRAISLTAIASLSLMASKTTLCSRPAIAAMSGRSRRIFL